MTLAKNTKISLYDQDYMGWIEQVVQQLKAQDFSHLDLENLVEELEDLGKREKRAIASYLMRLCEHLLKMKYWESERNPCFRGWDVEITNFRLQIQRVLATSPSLRPYLQDCFVLEYSHGRQLCLKASGLVAETIPTQPWFTLDQALDQDWLPWQP